MLKNIKRQVIILIQPKSKDKDKARREYILNILLLGSILLSFVALLASWTQSFLQYFVVRPESINITSVFLLFIVAYFFSRRGYASVISVIIISFYFFVAASLSFHYGIDVPAALISYALVIVMSGILISSRFSFVLAIVTAFLLPLLNYHQKYGNLPVDLAWKNDPETMTGAMVYGSMFVIISLVSWLFNSEGEKALKRARESEAALKKQNDELENIVEARTQELHKMQVEKLLQMYRFAEFGRISSGLFHDLVNHLSLISLNLDRLHENSKELNQQDVRKLLDRTISGTKRLESFVFTARKQMQNQEVLQTVSLKNEIKEVMQMLAYKAKKVHVQMSLKDTEKVEVFGNPIKFSQVMTNLIVNAIDAYDGINKKDKRVVLNVQQKKGQVIISVQDWGSGIDEKVLPKIFDTLFTTKSFEKGMGLGLTVCKEIIEKDFKGKILVDSREGEGTTFTILFPLQKTPTGEIKSNSSSK